MYLSLGTGDFDFDFDFVLRLPFELVDLLDLLDLFELVLLDFAFEAAAIIVYQYLF